MHTSNSDKLGYQPTTSELNTSIHNGFCFSYDADGVIPKNSSIMLLGKTGNKEVHFHSFGGLFEKGDVRITLYEAPTVTANGTPVFGANMNFTYQDDHELLIFSAPTITNNGVKKASVFAPISGGGANVHPSTLGIAGGRVLTKNTDYLIVVTNLDTNAACAYGVNFIWSENPHNTGSL